MPLLGLGEPRIIPADRRDLAGRLPAVPAGLSVNRAALTAGEWVKLLPWGRVERNDGRFFVVDDITASATIDKLRASGVDMVVDYEHHTLGGEFASPDGKAVAAGWIQELKAVPGDGLYGRVAWTPAADAHIAARQYRYLSPVVAVDPNTRQALYLYSVGLTNSPAIRGAEPLANRHRPGHRDQVIAQARREYEANRAKLSKLCSPSAWMGGALREADLAPLTNNERQALEASPSGPPVSSRPAMLPTAGQPGPRWSAPPPGRLCAGPGGRRELVRANSRAHWIGVQSQLRHLTTEAAFVNLDLREAGLPLLPPSERQTYRGARRRRLGAGRTPKTRPARRRQVLRMASPAVVASVAFMRAAGTEAGSGPDDGRKAGIAPPIITGHTIPADLFPERAAPARPSCPA